MKNMYFLRVILVVTFVLFYFSVSSISQTKQQYIFYLKDGNIVKVVGLEELPKNKIRVQTIDGSIIVYNVSEIQRIEKLDNSSVSGVGKKQDSKLPVDNSNSNVKVTDFKKSGFINLTEINYCSGNDYSFGFRTVNGYQLNEHLFLGIGIGIDKYINKTFLPITFDARATILKGKVSPVFTANIGYAVGLNDVEGRLVINSQIGIKTYISQNVAYLFNVGYKWKARIEVETYISGYYTISTGFEF